MVDRRWKIAILDLQSSILTRVDSHLHSRDPQPQAINRSACCNIERPPIGIAPVHVGRVARHLDTTEEISLGIDHVNARRSGAVDVALDVHLQSIRIAWLVASRLIEEPSVAEGSIGFYIEDANVAALCR